MPTAFKAVVNAGLPGDFTATAAGKIGDDLEYDQWSVSSLTRASALRSSTAGCAEGNNPAGEPCIDHPEYPHTY